MIHVTGNTFPHRDLFKAWRGKWNNEAGRWEFASLSSAQLDRLRKTVGLMINECDDEPTYDVSFTAPPEPTPTLRSLIADILAGRNDTAPVQGSRPSVIYGDDQRWFNHFKDTDPTAFFGFSSLRKFTDYVADLNPPYDDDRRVGWDTDDPRWHGTPNMAAALRLARQGWAEGAESAPALAIPHATAPKRLHGVAGGSVNVGRMLAGNPAHMRRRAKLPGRRVVTLFVETFMSSGIKSDNAITRAILIAGIADVLEREGYICEIVAVVTTRAGSRIGHQAAITLKQAGERLALLDIVFALGHPSFFRRLVFAAVGASGACSSTWHNQGNPAAAFDMHHPTAKNEFYIKQLSLASQRRLDYDDPLSMLPFIEPDGLPVKIRND